MNQVRIELVATSICRPSSAASGSKVKFIVGSENTAACEPSMS